MCLIISKLRDVILPKAEYLKNGVENNSDGIGVAYWKNGGNEVTIKKDFRNINKLIKWIPKNITKKDALIIHFRNATNGLADKGNRHPFPLTKNWKLLRKTNLTCKIAVAHNGVIFEYSINKAKYSDTQKFVMDILSDDKIKNNLSNRAIRKLIENFISNDRLAFLDNSGKITLFGEFEKHKNIFYSNGSYKKYKLTEDEKVSLQDDVYLNGRSMSVVDNLYERNWGVTTTEAFSGYCEICLEKKLVRFVFHEDTNQSYSACKECEKKLKRGFFKSKNTNLNKLEQCGSCLNHFKKKELRKYGDLRICDICINASKY